MTQGKHEALKAAIQRGIDSGLSPRTPQNIVANVKMRLKNDPSIHIKP